MPTPPVDRACALLGLTSSGTRLLHHRANAVYHLPQQEVVLRLRYAPGGTSVQGRLHAAVEVARRLGEHGFPATTPLPVEQPVHIDGWYATAWRYVAQPERTTPTPEDLGFIVRELHALPSIGVGVPDVVLLGSLRADLDNHDPAASPVTPAQRAWLLRRYDRVERTLPALTAGLVHGLIHGDAHTGNLLGVRGGWRLGDWDSVGFGPLVQDAIPTMMGHRRFGRSRDRWLRFCGAYGLDPAVEDTAAAGVLRSARELRSLAAYIRSADRPAVYAELHRRLGSLMNGDPHVWKPI
jgi:Ser/Thr protein kinase RdoA (MazF antagonist)